MTEDRRRPQIWLPLPRTDSRLADRVLTGAGFSFDSIRVAKQQPFTYGRKGDCNGMNGGRLGGRDW